MFKNINCVLNNRPELKLVWEDCEDALSSLKSYSRAGIVQRAAYCWLSKPLPGQTELLPFCCLISIQFFKGSGEVCRDVMRKCKVHNCRSRKQGNRVGLYAITYLPQNVGVENCPALL